MFHARRLGGGCQCTNAADSCVHGGRANRSAKRAREPSVWPVETRNDLLQCAAFQGLRPQRPGGCAGINNERMVLDFAVGQDTQDARIRAGCALPHQEVVEFGRLSQPRCAQQTFGLFAADLKVEPVWCRGRRTD